MDAVIFGLIVADVIARPMDLRRPPEPGGLHLIESLTLTTGGNVCNVALAMAKLGLKIGAAGVVGKDVLGRAVVDRLNDGGVDTAAVFATDRAQTSATVVAVEGTGERCFFHTPGANALLDADVFRQGYPIFEKAKWLQVGYFGLLPAVTDSLPALLGELRRRAPKLKMAMDTVHPPASPELLWPILSHLDLFAPSRPEAQRLTGETEPAKMSAAFRKHMRPDAFVAIKLDAQGCYIEPSPGQGELIPGYKIDLIDATGAGDTWFGGLLTGLIKKLGPARAAALANRAAADCCTAIGASTGVQSFEETIARV
jgi:ribokinase